MEEKLYEVREEGENWKIFRTKADVTLKWPIPYETPNSPYWPPLVHPHREEEIEWLWESWLGVEEVSVHHSEVFIKKYSDQKWTEIEGELQTFLEECFSEEALMLEEWRKKR